MRIEEMNREQLLTTIKQAFAYISKRNNLIFSLEDKIKELGGDPFFYMTEEEKKERVRWKEEFKDFGKEYNDQTIS